MGHRAVVSSTSTDLAFKKCTKIRNDTTLSASVGILSNHLSPRLHEPARAESCHHLFSFFYIIFRMLAASKATLVVDFSANYAHVAMHMLVQPSFSFRFRFHCCFSYQMRQ